MPYNPLFDRGYKSIGDYHSTKPVALGASERSGRVFSSDSADGKKEKTECGIHARNPEREKRLLEIAAKKAAAAQQKLEAEAAAKKEAVK